MKRVAHRSHLTLHPITAAISLLFLQFHDSLCSSRNASEEVKLHYTEPIDDIRINVDLHSELPTSMQTIT